MDQGKELGVDYAEFPVTTQAAERAKEVGMRTVMGAPNVVRGGASGGNASAADLVRDELVDGLVQKYKTHLCAPVVQSFPSKLFDHR